MAESSWDVKGVTNKFKENEKLVNEASLAKELPVAKAMGEKWAEFIKTDQMKTDNKELVLGNKNYIEINGNKFTKSDKPLM